MNDLRFALRQLLKNPGFTGDKPDAKSKVVIGRFDLEQTTFGLLGIALLPYEFKPLSSPKNNPPSEQ